MDQTTLFKPALDHMGAMGVDKAKQHGWEPIEGLSFDLACIPKGKLYVDHLYQRDEVSEKNINAIASGWNWVCSGVLVVCKRGDKYVVIEGQHRLMASMKRREIVDLPCIIFRFKDVEQEARAFLAINTIRKSVTAIDKHRAGIVANDELVMNASQALEKAGVRLVKDPKGSAETKAASCIQIMARLYGIDFAASVLSICRAIGWENGIPASTIRCVSYFKRNLHNGIDQRFVNRLIEIGNEGIIRAESKGALLGFSSGERGKSMGLLEAVNHGLRNRFRFKGDE